jgi:hypothetical protein
MNEHALIPPCRIHTEKRHDVRTREWEISLVKWQAISKTNLKLHTERMNAGITNPYNAV